MYYLFSDSKSRRFFKAQVSNMPVQLCTQVSEKLTLPPGSTCAFYFQTLDAGSGMWPLLCGKYTTVKTIMSASIGSFDFVVSPRWENDF